MKKIIGLILMLFTLNIFAQANLLGVMDIEIDSETKIIKTSFEFNPKSLNSPNLMFHQTLGKSFWKIANINCQWRNVKSEDSSLDQEFVTADSYCPDVDGDLILNLTFLKNTDPSFRILARVVVDGYESSYLLNKWAREIKIKQKNYSFSHYISMGTDQIGATPEQWITGKTLKLPSRLEHLLFAIALIVTSGTFIHTFKAISGFAFGCFFSLAMATYGIITMPTNLVQSAIALSIVYVAASGVMQKKTLQSFWGASLFGLIHGFGFSTAIMGLKLTFAKTTEAIIGYNLGLYFGLILIILLLTPVILLIKKYTTLHHQFIRSSAFSVMIIGSYLFIERTLF